MMTPSSSSNLSSLSLDPSLSLSIEECRSDRTPWSDSSFSSSPEFTTTTRSSTTTSTPTNLSEDLDHDYYYASSSSNGDDCDTRRNLEGCTRTARSSTTRDVANSTLSGTPSVTGPTPTMGMARLKKKKRFPCSLCEETFSRRHDMMRHESAQHGKIQEWTCEKCRRFFSSEAMLMVHRCPALR
ncbi:hypothetical protein K435DRAFT_124222 [Dendrothele bispora CBS 962.96]|uniref:C2H2-type domain-containing protein n=1 Tax=Dendrothele bispora (strain CBS 962.96) TaxID=1314807 RepID=A0A4S8M0M8_DENBC|nr:hypothetical protein K435DRAFT_124222 [Dendrothele bispora CBS 962.96]